MTMNRNKAISIAVAMLCSSSAFAQMSLPSNYNPSWYVTPSVNLMDPDSDLGTNKRGEGLGLRFGKPMSPNWDIQYGLTGSRVRDGGGRFEQLTLGADALYLFSRDRFRPFVMVGAGAERDKISGAGGNTSKTSPYISAGFGMQYSFNDQWSTQIDLRRVHGILRDNTFGFKRMDTDYLTIGLTYTFDKPRAAVVAQRPEPAPAPVYVPPPAPVYVAPAPAPAPKPVVTPPPAPRFERITLSATELFDFDSAALVQPQPKLDEVAEALKGNMQLNDIDVTGYTDRLGSSAYNLKLSQQRADSVKNYLVGRGVAANRLRAEGRGAANPVATCTDRNRTKLIECLAPNRRVEVEQITIERRIN